jgi:hypothetical protein
MLPDTWLASPFGWLLAAAIVLGLLGAAAAIAMVRAVRARRPLKALIRLLLLIALDMAALAALFLALALHGYGRLTTETPVARLAFRQTGAQQFIAAVHLPDGRRFDAELNGDEWQLDARVVKWQPWAVLAGLDPVYRLDRLSGRYRDIEAARANPVSAHDLGDGGGFDLWQLAQQYPRWLPFVDTEYGSGAYLPMRDGAAFEVSLSPLGGLVAREAGPASVDAPGG